MEHFVKLLPLRWCEACHKRLHTNIVRGWDDYRRPAGRDRRHIQQFRRQRQEFLVGLLAG